MTKYHEMTTEQLVGKLSFIEGLIEMETYQPTAFDKKKMQRLDELDRQIEAIESELAKRR